MTGWRFGCALLVLAGQLVAQAAEQNDSTVPVQNVILMIADGAGYNSWAATAMYEGSRGQEFYDEPGWFHVAVSGYALRGPTDLSHSPPGQNGLIQLESLVYDPARAWDSTPVLGGPQNFPFRFAGYRWLRLTAPDSASTMTAISGGLKTFDGSINFDGKRQPIERTLAQLAKDGGRRVGVVTSVLLSHATAAAAAGAHQQSRLAYCPLAVEMLSDPRLDLLAGCGNPDFDNNGRPIEDSKLKEHRFVGGPEIWELLLGKRSLEPGDRICAEIAEQALDLTGEQIEQLERWTLVQRRAKIERLRRGTTPERLLIVPQVGRAVFGNGRGPIAELMHRVSKGGTLQQQRGSRADPRHTPPGFDPPLDAVPSLASLTAVALNALDDDPDGFLLTVEGGAVDWAMHANQLGRMVEEMIDFKAAVRAVIQWVDQRQAWDHTLLLVTSDHDHLLWGPNSDTVPFQPLVDNGPGRLPYHHWLSDWHSNALIPLYVKGAGAERLVARAVEQDPVRGHYLDQTDIFDMLQSVLEVHGQKKVPGTRSSTGPGSKGGN